MPDAPAAPERSEFAPSRNLVELVRRARQPQDAGDVAPAALPSFAAAMAADSVPLEDPLAKRITLRISRMLATLAGMAAAKGEAKIHLTRAGRLTDEMRENVASRLGLDERQSDEVFAQIADELRAHAGKLDGRWGELRREGDELVIVPRPIEGGEPSRDRRARALLGPRRK